jgi:hypothetical protein
MERQPRKAGSDKKRSSPSFAIAFGASHSGSKSWARSPKRTIAQTSPEKIMFIVSQPLYRIRSLKSTLKREGRGLAKMGEHPSMGIQFLRAFMIVTGLKKLV